MTERPVVVLHVLEALSYGTSRHVVDVVRHTPGVQHHVAVPSVRSTGVTDTRAAEAIGQAGGQVHVVDMRRFPVHPANVRALAALTALAKRLRVDVVHGHSAIGGALARSLPVRAVRVYTPNGFPSGRAALAIERLLGRRTDRLIAVSPSEAEYATAKGLVGEGRLAVIPNGVDLEPPAPSGALRAALNLPAGVPLVGAIGRLDQQKAPLDAVAMWRAASAAHPTAHFVMVGDGALAQQVDEAASGLPRFSRLDYLEHAADAMADLDLFVLLSAYEGGPYAALEAARAGVPLVLTDVVGSRDVVEHGRSGVLVPFGRPAEAAREVLDLLADAVRRRELASAMRGRLAAKFDVRRQGALHADLYRALVNQELC